jgi:hypothetical protein
MGRFEQAPGGYPLEDVAPGTLFCSETVPSEHDAEEVIASSVCIYEWPLLGVGDGPSQSPPLHFDLTSEAVWTLNIDRSLYHRTDWSEIAWFEMDQARQSKVEWRFRGAFVGAEFTSLRLEPRPDEAADLLRLVRNRSMRIKLDLPSTASN